MPNDVQRNPTLIPLEQASVLLPSAGACGPEGPTSSKMKILQFSWGGCAGRFRNQNGMLRHELKRRPIWMKFSIPYVHNISEIFRKFRTKILDLSFGTQL